MFLILMLECAGYLNTFNSLYPLFRRDAVWDLLERQYGNNPPPAGPAFAALNAILAIGCCLATDAVRANLQRVDPSCTESLYDMSWKFFQNAYSMFFSILFVQFDLLAVQTLVAMVIQSMCVLCGLLTISRHFSSHQR